MPSKANFRLSITTKINAILIILATIFLPCSYVTYHLLRATSPVKAATDTKLLLDPGPRHKCYNYRDLAKGYSYISKASECEAVQGYSGCPTWRYSSYGSNQNHSDLLVNKDNGALIDVALVNNARHVNDEPSQVSLDYYYPGCSIQKLNNLTQFNLLDFDQWIFEYDVTIRIDKSPLSYSNTTSNITFGNKEHRRQPRRYLATKFIYQYPDTACLSTTNNSSTGISAFNASTASHTACKPLESTIIMTHFDTAALSDNSSYSYSNSHLLQSPSKSNTHHHHLSPNPNLLNETSTRTHHISIDFKQLYHQHLSHTTPSNIYHSSPNTSNTTTETAEEPAWLNAHMIRIVSGALGTDSVVEVGNVSAVLRKGKGTSGTSERGGSSREMKKHEVSSSQFSACGSGNGSRSASSNMAHARRSEIGGRGTGSARNGEGVVGNGNKTMGKVPLRVRKRFAA